MSQSTQHALLEDSSHISAELSAFNLCLQLQSGWNRMWRMSAFIPCVLQRFRKSELWPKTQVDVTTPAFMFLQRSFDVYNVTFPHQADSFPLRCCWTAIFLWLCSYITFNARKTWNVQEPSPRLAWNCRYSEVTARCLLSRTERRQCMWGMRLHVASPKPNLRGLHTFRLSVQLAVVNNCVKICTFIWTEGV
jgi:hypothetical protein